MPGMFATPRQTMIAFGIALAENFTSLDIGRLTILGWVSSALPTGTNATLVQGIAFVLSVILYAVAIGLVMRAF